MLTQYAKAIVYIALAAVTFLITALSDDAVTVDELLNLAVIVLGAVVLYLVPNLPTGVGSVLKTIVAFSVAGIVALLSFLTGGVTVSEWLQVGVAALAGVGVYIVPNQEFHVLEASAEVHDVSAQIIP